MVESLSCTSGTVTLNLFRVVSFIKQTSDWSSKAYTIILSSGVVSCYSRTGKLSELGKQLWCFTLLHTSMQCAIQFVLFKLTCEVPLFFDWRVLSCITEDKIHYKPYRYFFYDYPCAYKPPAKSRCFHKISSFGENFGHLSTSWISLHTTHKCLCYLLRGTPLLFSLISCKPLAKLQTLRYLFLLKSKLDFFWSLDPFGSLS